MRSISKTLLIANTEAVRNIWICVFLSIWGMNVGQPINAFPDNRSFLIALGDSLYGYENYYEAITEYKRFAVFHPLDPQMGYVYSRMGLAYQKLGEWENSVRVLLRSIELSSDEKLKNKNRISIAVTSIANGDYLLALLELQKVVLFCRDKKLLRNALFFQTVAYIYMGNWQKAKNAFHFFVADSMEVRTRLKVRKIDSLLAAGAKRKFKSPSTAKWLSTILPGTGQFYNERYKDALNAFGLNGINFGFTYHLIRKEAYVDASLFFLYLGIRYYAGNRYHAEIGSKEYNSNLIDTYKSRFIAYLLEFSHEL